MPPPEQDVTLVRYQLDCKVTEDAGGDEPYMWILGFKVDADTIRPTVGSLLPTLGVNIFEGAPASPFLLGSGSTDDEAPKPILIPIQPALGTRSFRLRPYLLVTGEWFPGIAGIIAVLFDQDAFSPSTSEAGYKAFRSIFGPALSTELTKLLNDGGYDTELSKDANGNVVSPRDENALLQWRLGRLGNAAARKNAIKAITSSMKGIIKEKVTAAVVAEAGLDELIDQDDQLGVTAEAYLGNELSSTVRDFTMDFTDDEANYTARGYASGHNVRAARIDDAVIRVQETFDDLIAIWARVCWSESKLYFAFAYKESSTTRFDLRNYGPDQPAMVRWFLDGRPLAGNSGAVMVDFAAADAYFGPPQDMLADMYPGGSKPLTYTISGGVLELSNIGGEGVYTGTVTALYSFVGDPTVFPQPDQPFDQLRNIAYEVSLEVLIMGVYLTMDDAYKADVAACKQVVDEIDRKHIAVNFGKAYVKPGDPPPYERAVLDRVTADVRIAKAVGLTRLAPEAGNIQRGKRR